MRPGWAGGSGPLGASSASRAPPGLTTEGIGQRDNAPRPPCGGRARPRPGPHDRGPGNGHAKTKGPFGPTRGAGETAAAARLWTTDGGWIAGCRCWMWMWLDHWVVLRWAGAGCCWRGATRVTGVLLAWRDPSELWMVWLHQLINYRAGMGGVRWLLGDVRGAERVILVGVAWQAARDGG